MGYTFSFEKLGVWDRSRDLVKSVYTLTKDYPVEEKHGIVSQIRRAAISVSNNLAEGSSRKSQKDQAHFTQISFTSLMEVLNLLILSKDLGFINKDEFSDLRPLIEEISNKLNALRNSQLNK